MVRLGELVMIMELHRQGLRPDRHRPAAGHRPQDGPQIHRPGARAACIYGPRAPRPKAARTPFVPYLRGAAGRLSRPDRGPPVARAARAGLYRRLHRGQARRAGRFGPTSVQPFEVRIETPPGAQGQVDLARFEVTFTDEPGVQARRLAVLLRAGLLTVDLGPLRRPPGPRTRCCAATSPPSRRWAARRGRSSTIA